MVSFSLNLKDGEQEIEVLTKDGLRKISASDIKEFTCMVCGKTVRLWKENSDRQYCSSECLFRDKPFFSTNLFSVLSALPLAKKSKSKKKSEEHKKKAEARKKTVKKKK